MRKMAASLIVALLVASSLALAGCSQWFENPAKPANDAIAVANTHLMKAVSLETTIDTGAAELDTLPYTKAGASQGLQLTAALSTTLASEKSELEAAKAAMDTIADLDVGPEFKQYANLESTAIETRITLTDTSARLYEALDKLYGGLKAKKGASVDPRQIMIVIGEIKTEIGTLTDQAVQQTKAASDYFTANKLGGS
jgi:hypothetical protein